MKRLATPYKRANDLNGYDAIVIGSGIGGLGAAALLSRLSGQRVLVLERHYEAGGYTHTFRRPGYEWDVGVHYIGSVHPKTMLGKFLGLISDGSLQWEPMDEVYDRIIIGDNHYDLPAGRQNLKRQLTEYFPEETKAIEAYFRLIREAAAASGPYFLSKLLPPLLAQVLRPRLLEPFYRFSRRTTREVLEELTDNQRLIAVLTGQWGDYGLPPAESSFAMHAMLVTHYIHGAVYPVGGSRRIAEAIVPVIEASGGQVLVRAEVEEILVEAGRATGVRMTDGRTIHAPTVISSAGVFNTFERLLSPSLAQAHDLPARLQTIQPSAAHLCLYLGLEHTAEELGLEKTNLWIYPGDDIEARLHRAYEDPEQELPLIYISFPSAKDPDFTRRFPGKATIEMITVAPVSWFKKWRGTDWKNRGEGYEAFKESISRRLLEELYRQLPQLRGKVDHCELSTPLTTQHFMNYQDGEIYGIDHSPARFEQEFLRPRTPISGLYLTGQDIATCGIAGALFGGVLTAGSVLLHTPASWPRLLRFLSS